MASMSDMPYIAWDIVAISARHGLVSQIVMQQDRRAKKKEAVQSSRFKRRLFKVQCATLTTAKTILGLFVS